MPYKKRYNKNEQTYQSADVTLKIKLWKNSFTNAIVNNSSGLQVLFHCIPSINSFIVETEVVALGACHKNKFDFTGKVLDDLANDGNFHTQKLKKQYKQIIAKLPTCSR